MRYTLAGRWISSVGDPFYNVWMFDFLTRRRRLTGGLYFGSPGWLPEKIEEVEGESSTEAHGAFEVPTDREGFLAFLERMGMGRTSAITPSLVDQMRDVGDRRIRALVLNLLPTQPEFALSAALSRLAMNEMVAGLAMVQRVVGAKRVIIAVDRHEYRMRRLWRRAMRPHRAMRYCFAKLLNRYPQGHPTLLLRSLFGKRTAVGKLPTRANRILVDPVACWALGRVIGTGRPMTQRPVQLFVPGSKEPTRLAMATIGESIRDFCERVGVATGELQVIVNGMMAGEEVDPGVARVSSSTESISVRERPAMEKPAACFSCGWCLDVCPTGLNPVNLLDLADRAQRGIETAAVNAELRSWDARESLHCIGCGLCSYVCPTRLPLTQQALRLRSWVTAATESRPAPSGATPQGQ